MLNFIGLLRSGKTISWETLKQDLVFRAWDEPFNPLKLARVRMPYHGMEASALG